MSAFKLVSMLNPTVVLTAGPAISAGTSSQGVGTIVFADANNVTFGLSNGTITATAAGGGGGGGIAAAAGTQTGTTGTIVFANSNGLTFGMSGSSRITGSYTVPTQTQFILSNSNGISFGTNGSTVTASYTVPTQSVQTQASGAIAGTGYTSTTQAGSAVGATLNTAGLSAAWPPFITTFAAQTTQTQPAGNIAGAGYTSTTQAGSTVGATHDSNGLSMAWPPFITTFAGQTTQTQPAGNIAGVGTTFNGANISGSMTLDTVGLALSLSVAPGGGGADGYNILAAGSQTANTTGTVAFVDSNGITWGMSNSSRITASYSQSTHSHSTAPGALAAGTQTATSGTIVFADSNGLTWGMSGSSQVTASYSQSTHSHSTAPGGLAAGTQTATSGTVVFSNSNGISFGMSNSSVVTASYTVPSTAGLLSAVNVSAGTTSNNLSALTFANANGVTFGLNASTVTASHNGLTTARASNDAVGLNTALTAGPLAWTVNSSGISLNASSVAGTTSGFTGGASISGSMTHNTAGLALSLSHPAWLTTAAQSIHGHTLTVSAQSNTTLSSSGTLDMAGMNVQGAGIVSVGVSNNSLIISATGGGGGVTPVASASNGSFSFTTLAFSNANNVTFGTSAGSIITASVAAPGAAAEQNAINLLGANTAGNTTVTGSTIGWSGVNVTLSGTNASQVVISAPATSSLVGDRGMSISTAGSTISIQAPVAKYLFLPSEGMIANLSAHANGTMSVQNKILEGAHSATALIVPMNISSVSTAANNSSAGINFSISFAIYSENANTLSSMSSTTFSTGATWSSNSTGSVTGAVFMTTPFNALLTPGEYYFGMNISTAATGGTLTGAATTSLGNTLSVMGANTANLGAFSWHVLGSNTNAGSGWAEAGLYTGTTAFSNGINLSAVSMQGTAAQRALFGFQLNAQ
jgi:hypothetical protein